MPRSSAILIRLTAEEARSFKRAAKSAGLGVGPWLRSLGMARVAIAPAAPKEPREIPPDEVYDAVFKQETNAGVRPERAVEHALHAEGLAMDRARRGKPGR